MVDPCAEFKCGGCGLVWVAHRDTPTPYTCPPCERGWVMCKGCRRYLSGERSRDALCPSCEAGRGMPADA
ncbi:MAG: hypothetical protein PHS14_21270 [Elusimicrobia bacterium]|nr:hypothetical protein [Elusimicrobiota bacterium]